MLTQATSDCQEAILWVKVRTGVTRRCKKKSRSPIPACGAFQAAAAAAATIALSRQKWAEVDRDLEHCQGSAIPHEIHSRVHESRIHFE